MVHKHIIILLKKPCHVVTYKWKY